MSGICCVEGIEAGGGDGRGAGRERDAGVVVRRGRAERDGGHERGFLYDVGVCDGAWGRYGHIEIHGQGAGGSHGVRGDRLGIGDVGEVPGFTGSLWIEAGSGDGGEAGRERDAGMVV